MCKVKSAVPGALNLRLGVSSVVSPDMSQRRAAEDPGDLAGRRLQVMAKRGKGSPWEAGSSDRVWDRDSRVHSWHRRLFGFACHSPPLCPPFHLSA